MTKSELKTGMIVTLRSGGKYMVFLNTGNFYWEKECDSFIVEINGNRWDNFSGYNEDLTNKAGKHLDIMKVERLIRPWELTSPTEHTVVIWERKEKKTYTYAQLREILGEEFEVIG